MVTPNYPGVSRDLSRLDHHRATDPVANAAERGDLHEVKDRIEGGTPIDLPDSVGDTPLMISVRNNQTEVSMYLIDKGANVDRFIMKAAILRANLDLVKVLVNRGERIRAYALVRARRQTDIGKYQEFLDYLLQNGADINAQRTQPGDYHDFTALHIAVRQRDFDMVKYLVDNGADLNIRTKRSAGFDTPLDLAERGYRITSGGGPGIHTYFDVPPSPEIAQFLRSRGAK